MKNARAIEAVGLFLLVVWGCAVPKTEEPRRDGATLQLLVSYGTDGVAVKNVDPAGKIYRALELKLNMARLGKNSGVASAGDLGPGKAVTVPFYEFIDSDLHRFDIRTTAILTVFVKGEVDGAKTSGLFLCPGFGQKCARAPDQ
jgi:hypothetical protein